MITIEDFSSEEVLICGFIVPDITTKRENLGLFEEALHKYNMKRFQYELDKTPLLFMPQQEPLIRNTQSTDCRKELYIKIVDYNISSGSVPEEAMNYAEKAVKEFDKFFKGE